MYEYPDLVNFTREELVDEYCKLYGRFKELCVSNEADAQRIHELKRSLGTAIAAQDYLAQELEQYTNLDDKEIKNDVHKARAELLETKKKCEELEVSLVSLRQDYSLLLEENAKLSKYVSEPLKCNKEHVSDADGKSEDYLYRIRSLENENEELLCKMEEFEERAVGDTRKIAECEKTIEVLRDQILCLEENLQSKRTDLEEKRQIIESTQEQLSEANAKIAELSVDSDNSDRKGNSLFAEVDDQRQAMRQLLTTQKKNYLEMKKVYNESEHEIRRLKRENISMHTELEACSRIFCNADKIYQEKLNDRISSLLGQNEYLENKLKYTQDRLKELADDRGVLFLDSMLNFCKNETDYYKDQLHSARIQQARVEEQLRNSQQDMARWRFESLKSRCILNDREHILTENKIPFKPIHALEYNISETQLEEAKPRIVPCRRSNPSVNAIGHNRITPSNASNNPEVVNEELNTNNIAISNNTNIKNADPITVPSKTEEKTDGSELSCVELKSMSYEVNSTTVGSGIIDLDKSSGMSENKENIDENVESNTSINSTNKMPILNKFAKLKANPPSPMRPSQRPLEELTQKRSPPARSILSKQSDLLFKDSCKNVQFSSHEDIIHNLSADTSFPPACSANDSNPKSSPANSKTIVKQSRNKSNIIVRRVIVSSKHD